MKLHAIQSRAYISWNQKFQQSGSLPPCPGIRTNIGSLLSTPPSFKMYNSFVFGGSKLQVKY